MNKLEKALSSFLGSSELTKRLALVLGHVCRTGRSSYSEVEIIAGDGAEDVLLLSTEWRLLLPVKSVRGTMEWADWVFLTEPGEIYEMPVVAKFMVENANQTGEWDSHSAVTKLFREMEEPDWHQMSALVERLRERARGRRVNAVQIKEACDQLGLGERVDPLIAELKAGGIISPKVGSLFEVIRAGSPIYELNPSLFVKTGGKERLGENTSPLVRS